MIESLEALSLGGNRLNPSRQSTHIAGREIWKATIVKDWHGRRKGVGVSIGIPSQSSGERNDGNTVNPSRW